MPEQLGVRDLVESAPPGSSVLISGPPMTGKYELFVRLLAGERAIAISTDTDAGTLREAHGKFSDPALLSIIDCASQSRGAETPEIEGVRYVPGPGNLTRIGITFTDLLDEHGEGDVRVGLHSISQLLLYSELRSVYRFLQVFTGQVQSAGWRCIGTLDPSMHDEQAVNTVLDPFDARIETRTEDGTREARISGLGPAPSEWLPF